MNSPTGTRFVQLVLTLGALAAIGPLTVDMYLPAFPLIGQSLGASDSLVQLSLASYFIGLAIGQVVYGPLADRFGRKLPLYIGLTIYCLASVACALAASIHLLIALRFFQALGSCSGMVISRAMVRDLFEEQESAQVFSLLMLVMGVAPILAPLLGGFVAVAWGWRAIFMILAVFSSLCLILVASLLPETRGPDPSVQWRRAFPVYWTIIKSRRFIGYTLAGGLAFSGMFAYITGSPYVFITHFGVPAEKFGWIFGANAFALVAFSQINGRLLRTRTVDRVLTRSLPLLALFGGLLVVGGFLDLGLWGVAVPLFLFIGILGMVFPNATAGALATQRAYGGSASALLGTLQFTLAASASGLVSLLHNGTVFPMTGLVCLCGFLALISYFTLVR